MARSNQHFKLTPGKTWGTDGTAVAAADYGDSVNYEGCVQLLKNWNPSTNLARDGTDVVCLIVRNVTGITLSGGDAVIYKSGYIHKRVDGKVYVPPADTTVKGRVDGIIHDAYGSSSVYNGHLFLMVIKGQVLAKTAAGADALNVLAVGSELVAATAQSSQEADVSGRLALADLNAATIPLANMALGSRIRALSAMTTSQTNTSVLVQCDLQPEIP